MSYRRNDRAMGPPYSYQYKNKKSRRRKSKKEDKPTAQSPFYKNAKRIFCAASLTEKWLFHSNDAAKNAIRYNAREKLRRGKEAKYERAYYCKACGGYHITTMSKKQWSYHKRKALENMGIQDSYLFNSENNAIVGGGFQKYHKKS